MKSVTISRNEVVVANLLREQIELVRNIRDTNIIQAAKWDSALIKDGASYTYSLWSGSFIIGNDFTATGVTYNPSNWNRITSPVFMSWITIQDINNFTDDTKLQSKFEASQLCYDDKTRYIHCNRISWVGVTNSWTIFASYINIIPMQYTSGGSNTPIKKDGNDQWYIIDARVIVRDWSNYREYDARSAITDWIK